MEITNSKTSGLHSLNVCEWLCDSVCDCGSVHTCVMVCVYECMHLIVCMGRCICVCVHMNMCVVVHSFLVYLSVCNCKGTWVYVVLVLCVFMHM